HRRGRKPQPGHRDVPRGTRSPQGRGPFPHRVTLGAQSEGGVRGKTIVNRVPAAGSLATEIEPPCASTRLLAMASPRPAPLESGVFTKRSNTCGSTSGGIPGPVSEPESATLSGSVAAPTETTTDP